MPKKLARDIVHRFEGNPVLTIEQLSFSSIDIFNAGVVKLANEYLLLLTVKNMQGHHLIYLAKSTNGYNFEISDSPIISPSIEQPYAPYEEWGVLDARITQLENWYYISYDVLSRHGYRTGLAQTKDFKRIKYLGIISEPDTKGATLFPEKINGKYARIERPGEGKSIWISYSDDLEYWGWAEVVLTPRGGFWDCDRVGVGTPPVKIKEGWLFLYYGVKNTSAGPLYRLGAAILNKNNPARIIGRTNVPILSPREIYERIGDLPNLIFSCGLILEPNNEVKIYYGSARSCICLGTTKLEHIVQACTQTQGF